MTMRRLSRPFAVKSLSGDGTFTGYGSVFDVEDWYGEVVEKGAFTATIAAWKAKGRAPAMLWQHDSDKPIGCWVAMAEDAKGLVVDGQLALKTRDGADAYEHLKAGTISGLSIGFVTPKGGAEWDPKTETYRLRQIDLWEVSPVTFPANEDAQIESVKTAMSSPREFERFLREAGLSRNTAKAVMAGGYQAIAQRDAAIDYLKEKILQLTTTIRG